MAAVTELNGTSNRNLAPDANARFRPRSEGLVEETEGSEVILIDIEGTVAYTLNGAGLDIWEQIRLSRSTDEIAGVLSRRYSLPLLAMQQEVEDLIQNLAEEGLIETAFADSRAKELQEDPDGDQSEAGFISPVLTKIEGLPGELEMMKGYAIRLG